MMLFLTILGVLVGILGVSIALIQYRSRIKTERILKTQLSMLINRIYAMVPNSDRIKELLKDVKKPELIHWVNSTSKGLPDIYSNIVGYYLSYEKKFTYENLDEMKRNGVIRDKWQENIWRDVISRLPENLKGTGS